MKSSTHIELVKLQKSQIRHAKVFSGISPKAMRRVFSTWVIFAILVWILVMFAPGLSSTFILSTALVLVVFTIAMFAQSRVGEGWPAVLVEDDKLHVVRDPYKREFFRLSPELVAHVEGTLIKPNKKAIALVLHTEQLAQEDINMLNQAVWPREDRLLALAHFISRDKACENLNAFIRHQVT
ncbi:hypothetical protein IT774_06175 [Salinimonas marina]|uniref:Uncharacterized protein n=1 Tax=Salinimonas marina TaxID=2785918 RepID=A0A7S9DZV6_9ALTE|nr:hypothetical protein [Salinimonas marina]QPG06723.1 hypothetical protein IT774_06175 [Salinimonas marina]